MKYKSLFWVAIVASCSLVASINGSAVATTLPPYLVRLPENTTDPFIDSVDDWKEWAVPENMLREFPVYIAGYDYDKRPGRWDIRKYADKGDEERRNLLRFAKKFLYTLENIKSPYPDAEDGIIYVIESSDYKIDQLLSTEAHAFTHSYLNLIRPVAGKWIAKAEVFAPGEARTRAVFGKFMPSDQIPSWYGGSNKNYKPVVTHILKWKNSIDELGLTPN